MPLCAKLYYFPPRFPRTCGHVAVLVSDPACPAKASYFSFGSSGSYDNGRILKRVDARIPQPYLFDDETTKIKECFYDWEAIETLRNYLVQVIGRLEKNPVSSQFLIHRFQSILEKLPDQSQKVVVQNFETRERKEVFFGSKDYFDQLFPSVSSLKTEMDIDKEIKQYGCEPIVLELPEVSDKDYLDAMQVLSETSVGNYHFLTHNCAHYAVGVLRQMGYSDLPVLRGVVSPQEVAQAGAQIVPESYYLGIVENQIKVLKEECKNPKMGVGDKTVLGNLANSLQTQVDDFKKIKRIQKRKEAFPSFHQGCLEEIQKPEVQQSFKNVSPIAPTLKCVGINIALAVIGLGIFYAAVGLINYKVSGHFFFCPPKRILDPRLNSKKDIPCP